MTSYADFLLRIPGGGAFANKLPRFSQRANYVTAMATASVMPASSPAFDPAALWIPRLTTTAVPSYCIAYGTPSFTMGCGMLASYMGYQGTTDPTWPGPGSPQMNMPMCDGSIIAQPGFGLGWTSWPFTPNFIQLHGVPPYPSATMDTFNSPSGGAWPMAEVTGPYNGPGSFDFTARSQGGLFDPGIYGGDFTFTATPPGGSTWGLHVVWSGSSYTTEFVLRSGAGNGGTFSITLAIYLMDYSGGIGATPTPTWLADVASSTDIFSRTGGPVIHSFSGGSFFYSAVHLPAAWSLAVMPRVVTIGGAVTPGLTGSEFYTVLNGAVGTSATAVFNQAGYPACI